MSSNTPKLILVVGPTASGKSDLAVKIARKMNGEIISADSRQVYIGFDIGSGKITKKEMRAIPHHLLDVISPKGMFTVARYQKLGQKALRDILSRGKLPIVVGGTGLYIDSLIYETSLPAVKPNLKLRSKLEKMPAAELFRLLRQKDPMRAATIDRHNPRRLVRALEIIAGSGKPVPELGERVHSKLLSELGIETKDILKIGVAHSPEKLKRRIHKRLLARMRQGMVAEVKQLHAQGVSWKKLEELGLEYRYVSRYLRGLITKQEMIAELEKEIWRYARRQMTWWRKDKEIQWS
jgi:tRNA dimethylallyltransferase